MSMLLDVETLDTLQKLGLSTYEATAYMALTASGPTTATVLVAESEVPRKRIYGVLKRLEEKSGSPYQAAGQARTCPVIRRTSSNSERPSCVPNSIGVRPI